jgi:hypothetical protein
LWFTESLPPTLWAALYRGLRSARSTRGDEQEVSATAPVLEEADVGVATGWEAGAAESGDGKRLRRRPS